MGSFTEKPTPGPAAANLIRELAQTGRDGGRESGKDAARPAAGAPAGSAAKPVSASARPAPGRGGAIGTKAAAQSHAGKNTIEIKFLGQKVVLKSSESDPATTKEVVELVSRKLRDAETRGKSLPAHQVVLLALMELAADHIKAKRRAADYKKNMSQKAEQLLSLIDNHLKSV